MVPLKSHRSTALEASGFAVLRSPLLPMEAAWRWSTDLAATEALRDDDASLEQALRSDRQRLTDRLRIVYADPLLQRAVYVASRTVSASLERWLVHPGHRPDPKLVQTLASYLLRMSCRPTPFGWFAGCATIGVGETTSLKLAASTGYRGHSRLDVVYLRAMCRALTASPALRRRLSWWPNPGLYETAGQYRFAELASPGAEARGAFQLVSFEATAPLAFVVRHARGGIPLVGLAEALMSNFPDVTLEGAQGYLAQLVESQILVSELEPCVSGADALDRLIDTLKRLATGEPDDPAATLVSRLRRVRRCLDRMDTAAAETHRSDREIVAELTGIATGIPAHHHLHVDMYKPGAGLGIDHNIVETVARTINLLHGIAPPARRADLAAFVRDFVTRYQDREVPLMEALDEESGVGFGRAAAETTENSPLLNGLGIRRRSDAPLSWHKRDAVMLRLVEKALRAGSPVIALRQEDIDKLIQQDDRPLPAALAANVTVIATSAGALANGDFELLWHGAFGPSGALYLGRFCHGDPELYAAVQRHLIGEERTRPDAVFAEIVHLPQDKIGNVMCRPRLRAHEIPFHGTTDAPGENQILVSDLRVRVEDGSVILRSERLDREVIPRLTTAHNAAQAELGPYRFLCALQTQGVCNWLGWDWGVLQGAACLPRLMAGPVILARARWRLDEEMLGALAGRREAARMRGVHRLRDELGLPRWVQAAQGDRLLPLDLENVVCVESLRRMARGQTTLDLTEMLPTPESACLEGPEGRFNHELVIPFVQPRVEPARARGAIRRPRRLWVPGGDWLYVKIYAGVSEIDRLLCGPIRELAERDATAGSFDGWHFIRYADPETHLRVRFNGSAERLHALSNALHDALQEAVDAGSVWRVQHETYDPEIERYGGVRGMALAERLFRADSDAALDLLAIAGEDPDQRWGCTLLSIHTLLEDLHIELPDRIQALAGLRERLLGEFDLGDSALRNLGRKHRELRHRVDAFLTPADDTPEALVSRALEPRSRSVRAIAEELRAAYVEAELTRPLAQLAVSYVHMTANRMLRSAARAQELVLYELLIRHYRGHLSRTARRAAKRGSADTGATP